MSEGQGIITTTREVTVKRIPKYVEQTDSEFRIYKSEPEAFCIQLRGPKGYASVNVSPDEARRIGRLILETFDHHGFF
jgi:hypothetical protein